MKEINKDITKLKKGIIFQQVNCQNAMGSGVARAIYEKWPIVKIEFHKFSKNKNPNNLLGEIQEITITNKLMIVNSFSQLTYGKTGKHTNEEILIKNIRFIANKYKDKMIAIPYKIGAGLGGGNWDYIFDNIKDIPNLLICKYTPKVLKKNGNTYYNYKLNSNFKEEDFTENELYRIRLALITLSQAEKKLKNNKNKDKYFDLISTTTYHKSKEKLPFLKWCDKITKKGSKNIVILLEQNKF